MGLIRGLAVLLALGAAPWGLAQTAEDFFARCQRLYGQGALESARATCELALVSDPEHRPSLRLLARIHLERGELEPAERYLERLGEDPEGALLRARLLLRKGKPQEALRLPLPLGPEARLLQALALEELGRLEEALLLAQSLPPTPEARLLLARLHLALGEPWRGLDLLGPTLEEQVERGRLLFLVGEPQGAVALLEGVLPQTSGELRRQALATLTLAYLGQGDLLRARAALAQLGQVENLPARFLAWAWPWLLALLVFLVLVLLGESRIEPLRTVEVVEDPLPGPGRLYLVLVGAFLFALLFTLFLGMALFANALAFLTPYQRDLVLPGLFLVYGLALLLSLALWQRRRLGLLLGPWAGWVEGFWLGPLLVLLLLAYGLVREFLGFAGLPPHLLVFLGLALMEPFFRGLVPWVFRERYRDLAPYLSVLLFALAVPGSTPLLLLLGAGLLWARERTGGVLGLALGWVVAGVILALLPPAWLRLF
ncbi:tetratricopeptide repeat protein [Thermus thermamylovorans]|uniref:Tetratricopeptide repeat protein n=1 Tax=Thermus thermamylovorans TaxID=2509362 RepID=A0A4V2IV10_9DEIN|nr:tetratricopeptide repeat protein [Thermus thermamylovorans]TBH20486.1 tetratricopeptide repeat protein [Thermus thermamylovorans]